MDQPCSLASELTQPPPPKIGALVMLVQALESWKADLGRPPLLTSQRGSESPALPSSQSREKILAPKCKEPHRPHGTD